VVPLGRSHLLPSGVRVRLRPPRPGDFGPLAALHTRLGLSVADLELRRLLRVDPRRRLAITATAQTGGSETMVGFAAAEHGGPPDALLADERNAPGIGRLLHRAVREGVGGLRVA
jgi:hypothetical protein